MVDLAAAVQKAIYDRLLGAGIGWPVVTVAPDELKPPATVISESTFDEMGSKTRRMERHQVAVRHFIIGSSKLPLLTAMAKATAALHHQPLSATGVVLSDCVLLSGGERRDFDQKVLLAEQVFQVFAQEA